MNADDFLGLVKRRTSCRNYLEKPVPEEAVEKCLEAARLAPSACNKQPWRFVIVRDPVIRNEICENGLLPGIPMPWLKKAPVIAALCSELNIVTHCLAPLFSKVDYHLIDIGIAGEHFVLAAESQGLGTCWIGWFKEKSIRRLLSIPKSVKVLSLISLGYPASANDPVEKLAIEEICHAEKWGNRLRPRP